MEGVKTMSNSSLAVYTKLSPNHSGKRTMKIDRITPHCAVGQCTIEGLGGWFAQSSTQASSNYGIDKDGRVGLFVDEGNRSWCSSSNANDQRAVTIECASDTSEPYAFRDVVYKKLITLCVDICRRNGKTKLIWFGDKNHSLNYSPKSNEMILTVHRWFANKSCPGNWLYARMNDLAASVTKQLSGDTPQGATEAQQQKDEKPVDGLQASSLKNLSEADVIKMVGPLFTDDMKKSGILASVTAAQFILESGYGKSELAQKANNCFGMKKSLSGNTWGGSTWDGKSIYTKHTKEQKASGKYITITADFRKYKCIEDSIGDHSAYLLGAMNGSKHRYAGLKGETDYHKAAQVIKNGGYATSHTYVSKLCEIIKRWNLTQFDVKTKTPSTPAAPASGISVTPTQKKYIESTGTHYISNSGSDEHGKHSGGRASDQTCKEWRMRSWYNHPWDCVLRYPDQNVALKIALLSIDAALNDKIGYDQSQNRTYRKQLKAAGWEPSKVTVACEADCSKGVCANITATGYLLGIKALQDLPDTYGRKLRKALVKAGFKELTDSKYLKSGSYLLPGDILIYESCHTAANVTIGKNVKSQWKPGDVTPTPTPTPTPTDPSTDKPASAKHKDNNLRGAYKVVANGGLNMRTNAGTGNKIIQTIPDGATVQCYGYYNMADSTKWLYVVYNGKDGYCSSKYLQKK